METTMSTEIPRAPLPDPEGLARPIVMWAHVRRPNGVIAWVEVGDATVERDGQVTIPVESLPGGTIRVVLRRDHRQRVRL